jgi:glutamate-1-semialdehyde aminotransferase
MDGVRNICAEEGVPVQVIGHPSMIGIWLGDTAPTDFRDLPGHNASRYEEVVYGMIRRGVMPVDDAREPWFTCAAHTTADVGETLEAFSDSLGEALK